MLTRDVMLITYPLPFTLLLSVIMFTMSAFNCLRLQFYDQHPYPTWYLYVLKAAYIQVMMFAALTFKCTVEDCAFKNFVLIRYSKPRDMRKGTRKIALSGAPRTFRYISLDEQEFQDDNAVEMKTPRRSRPFLSDRDEF